MSNHKTEILFPVGRLVMGSLVDPQTKNKEGKPLLNQDGSARVSYFFAVAIPKNGSAAWWDTEWGKKILAVGQAAFPQTWNSPKFSWKIIDGDSATPNEDGNVPSKREGFPGNWVVRFSSGFAPKTLVADGSAATPAEAIKLGHYVEVLGNVDSNGSSSKPGVYINHSMVAHSGFGPEIVVTVDASQVGFGQAALPAGASATPIAAMAAPGTPPSPGTPGTPATPTPPAPIVTQPHTAILAGPPAPAAPPGPPAPAGRVMLPAAQGFSYESYVEKGWSDEQLIAAGMMQA
jgi:hypothetical protein